MTHFNQLLVDLNTIDYGLLCCDLYHLVDVPVGVISKDASHHSTESDWKPILGIGNVTVRGEFTTELTDPLKTVFVFWDKAQWVRYHKTDIGSVFYNKTFSNTWMEEENRETRIQDALSDLLSFTKKTIQFNLNRLLDLANRLIGSSKDFLDITPKDKRLPWVPLWWPLGDFERFHRTTAPSFNTVNYPPYGTKNSLYFGRNFLERYDLMVFKKVELIAFFIQKVRSLTNVTLNTELITQAEQRNSAFYQWESARNKFNDMPLNEVEKWFMQLATKKTFLTEDQVVKFINKAFCRDENIGKLTANLGDADLELMGALFYRYYTKCVELGLAMSKGYQKKYIELLTNNFTNYAHLGESLKTNFSKYNKRVKAWDDTI